MAGNASDEPRSSGIYGLFNLDGAPIAAADAIALGLPVPTGGENRLMAGFDSHAPEAVARHDGPLGQTVLVGELEEFAALVDRLGLRGDASAAQLAQAALAQFGSDTPAELIGEWSLLHCAQDGSVTVMQSAALRDRIFYAVSSERVAIAPNLFALARLNWVDAAIDEAGLLFPLGRADLRAARADRTMIKSVRQLEPASSVVVRREGLIEQRTAEVLIEPPRWTGSFGDAVAEAEELLRQIMQARLGRTRKAATLLSGGLDSSLLAWLCAEGSPTDKLPVTLTSTAPPGSGLADEAGFAVIVAQHLGLKGQHVWPASEANIYRPPAAILGGGSGPILSNRHCLTEAFQIAAKAAGATMLIDGTYGEMSVTARLAGGGMVARLRAAVGSLRGALAAPHPATDPFHVRLAPHRLAKLPDAITEALSKPRPARTASARNGSLGYTPGIEKALALPNEFYPGAVRTDYPFRDLRLLRLYAGFPVRTLTAGGHDRGLARQMLAGNLPDSIRLRRRGMPASPDHMARLQRQAAAARERIADFRKAEIDDWIDLDWLERSLESVSARGATGYDQANEVQLTAIAAEFLLGLRGTA